MIPGLLVTEGEKKGLYLRIPEEKIFWIGRVPANDFFIENDPMVSGKHGQFLLKGTILYFKDQSRNGTRLNSRKIHQSWAVLKLTDILRIGATHLQVIDVDENTDLIDSQNFDVNACLQDLEKREEFEGDSTSFHPIGAYYPIAPIGSGAFGVVYKAVHKERKKLVAMKVFTAKDEPTLNFMGRFLREAELLKKLNHPHLIRLYDAGQIEQPLPPKNYIAMEYFPGVNLRYHLRAHGKMPWQKVLKILMQLAEALDHMHQQGVIHRDLKPDNILYNDIKGIAKIIDLGFGKCILDEERRTLFITQTGSSLGTPYYMAPEQWVEAKYVTESADIYSLGATAYCLLAARPPYTSQDYLELFRAVSQQKFTPLETLCLPDTPKEFIRIIYTMMASDLKKRYSTSRKLLKELHAIALKYLQV